MARQSIYKRDGWDGKLDLVKGWARQGLTDEQIANNMGIGKTTLYDYKNKYPKFANALKKGKEVVDFEVENALLKRALGYNVEEYKKELVNGELQITEIKQKHIKPDTTAMIYWLKNRMPKYWNEGRLEDSDEKLEQFIDAVNDMDVKR